MLIGYVSDERFVALPDTLLEFAAAEGGSVEARVHSHEACKLELFRYGWEKEFVRTIGQYDEHGPQATVQITPDGDHTGSS